MKKALLINIVIVLVLVAVTAAATWAYFGSTKTEVTTITTAKIEIGQTWGFPLTFENLLPDEWAYKEVAIQNASTRAADFYIQMKPYDDGVNTNFCYKEGVQDRQLNINVNQINGWGGGVLGTWLNNTTICRLYPIDGDAYIAKIADDVPPGGIVYYQVALYLLPTAMNNLMNGYNTDYINFIAVQYNGPAPQVMLTAWPNLTFWPEGDPNY